MTSAISRSNWLTGVGLVLALPAAFFICFSILKYELNVSGLDQVEGFFERLGISESFGFNINLLILFGPVLAVLLSIFQVLRFGWQFTRDEFRFHLTVQKRWFPILVASFSIGLMAILLLYGIAENCNCPVE